MRIPEIKVFIFHQEGIYISMYKMKRLYLKQHGSLKKKKRKLNLNNI